MTAHRKCPIPFSSIERGKCRWCGKPVRYPVSHPRAGDVNTRANWHPACVADYRLHSDPKIQRRHLVARDGALCGACKNPECQPLNGEHTIPLWKVRHLPDAERIKFHHVSAMTLMGLPCHHIKSAREAAEKAHFNRLDPNRPAPRPRPKRAIKSMGFPKRARPAASSAPFSEGR